jgi:putative pyruvate formate lyase activating enzyme
MRSLDLERLTDCDICPRACHVDRTHGEFGVCGVGAGFEIASICLHRGEEPPLCGDTGICNVFFSRCNLSCVYCQNVDISRNRGPVLGRAMPLDAVVSEIGAILDRGTDLLGFVSPSHVIPQMRAIRAALAAHGRTPTVVMNTGGYDRVETLASLESEVDVYLPDMKYMDAALAGRLSGAADYPRVAAAALREMYRQKGPQIEFDDRGLARRGLIVRHLVLPGQVENSRRVLRFIARALSPEVHLSLMSQYHPMPAGAGDPQLRRRLRPDEYNAVLDEMDRLGFENGWTQELDASSAYVPDFSRKDPFDADADGGALHR